MTHSIIGTLARRHGRKVDGISRRDMLKATLAASAGLLISSHSAHALARLGQESKKRIVVIGAGFAGLACAHELVEAGYDVTVLEARPRIGGRVLSFNATNKNEYIRGRNIEGGGELIGSNHPTWVQYANQFGLEFLDVTEDEGDAVFPVVIDGKLLDFEEGLKLWEDMEAALNRMNELAANVPEDEPWNAPDAAKLDQTSTAAWIKSLDVPDMVKKAMLINQESDNGQAADRQSLLGQLAAVKGGGLESFWTDSEVYRCKGGNDQLAYKLAEKIGSKRIALKLAARSITLKDTVVVIEASDGRTLECDDVVLAVPPTTWNRIRFNPSLPSAMNPQMGLNTKFLAHVKTRFWESGEQPRSQYALSDGIIQQTWDGSDAQGPVDDTNGGACLTGFSGGPQVDIAEKMTKEQREQAFAAQYEKFYPGFKEQLVASRYMNWPKEEWTATSYSFPAPGQVTTVGPMMAKPHMNGRLHIAGEHACYKFVGYMEGALNSGASVAKRLAVRDGVLQLQE